MRSRWVILPARSDETADSRSPLGRAWQAHVGWWHDRAVISS